MTHLMKSAAETFGVSIDCCMTPKSRAPTATTHSHSHRPGAASGPDNFARIAASVASMPSSRRSMASNRLVEQLFVNSQDAKFMVVKPGGDGGDAAFQPREPRFKRSHAGA